MPGAASRYRPHSRHRRAPVTQLPVAGPILHAAADVARVNLSVMDGNGQGRVVPPRHSGRWFPPVAVPPPAMPDERAREYCRRARRVRSRYGGDYARMHVELMKLAREGAAGGAGDAPKTTAPAACRPVGDAVRRFAVEVLHRLDGGVLRYSERLRLLRLAQRLGIGRFEANLVIAVMEHRRRTMATPIRAARRRWPAIALVAATVQALIVLAVAAMLL